MPKTPANDVPPSFEKAMDELDGIVQAMEGDRLSLGELIEQYARGMKLEKICRDQLAEARQRVDTITRASEGETEIKPFDPDPDVVEGTGKAGGTNKRTKTEIDEKEDDEIRLF